MATINLTKRPRTFIDETGKRYGRLSVVQYVGRAGQLMGAYRCVCDCGNEIFADGGSLRKGYKSSCGCVSNKSPRLFVTADDCPPLPVIDGESIRHCPAQIGYAVTDKGVVWGCRSRRGWRIMAGSTNTSGYRQVLTCINGKRVAMRVHVLVLEAFVGPKPSGMLARHLDGNKGNNVPSNLAWGTASENSQDAVRHGTHGGFKSKGELNAKAKLSEADVRHILAVKGKVSQRLIAREFGVSQFCIQSILARTSWKHVVVEACDLERTT